MQLLPYHYENIFITLLNSTNVVLNITHTHTHTDIEAILRIYCRNTHTLIA